MGLFHLPKFSTKNQEDKEKQTAYFKPSYTFKSPFIQTPQPAQPAQPTPTQTSAQASKAPHQEQEQRPAAVKEIAWFEELNKNSGPIAGGKGANLGEMTNLGLPVPPGFAITTAAFEEFLAFNNIKDAIQELVDNCDVENTEQLLGTSKKIKGMIVNMQYPEGLKKILISAYESLSFSNQITDKRALQLISSGRDYAIVAIRSSATTEDLPNASFAGQQASFLNVKGVFAYLEAVKNCWASLYEPRAIFYRRKNGFRTASISVIVQRMVNAEKAGVIFTVNPGTGSDEIIIEACWGLGESLVLGEVQPDNYIVSKKLEILQKKVNRKLTMHIRDYATDHTIKIPVPKNKIEQQVLTDDEILKIAEFGKKIEAHYQHPQDIEFCVERQRIYIVQTRAVTTQAQQQATAIEGEPILKGLAASPGIASGVVRIVHELEDLTKVQKGDILVTTMTTPDMVVSMSKSSAIITDQGGVTCHASIVGREMGLPVIVGTQNATEKLHDGQSVTVDAYRGYIYEGAVEVEKSEQAEAAQELQIPTEKIETKTKVKVNLVFAKHAEEVAQVADGVGLLRIEHMITMSGVHPAKLIQEGHADEYIQILLEGIEPIAAAFEGKPVWIRTLDVRTDEFRHLKGGEAEPHEDNPMLGWHGIRRSLDEVELLKSEFIAVKKLHEAGYSNVHIMLPFVISVEEFLAAKKIAEDVGLPAACNMGIMVETAAAALKIEEFCKAGIKFASVGSNDLIQSVLCIDRNNSKISHLYNPYDQAVLALIKYVVDTCNHYGIDSSICGEAGSDEKMVQILVGYGISSVSANIDALAKIRKVVAEMEAGAK
jgi:pyruvate,water dikinase